MKMKTISQDSSVTSTEEADDIIVEPKPIVISPTPPTLPPEQVNLFKTFPWMADFIKLCHSEVAVVNIRSLEKLMNFYHKNVSLSVTECYSRPNRAAKLKRSMSDTLMFFHMSYSEFKPPFEHSSYLAKMSDLMAMYLDMEIKASRTGTESLPKIASKLTSCLHVYFGRSHDHILDTVLKTKIINKNSWELCDLIFRRVLRDVPGSSVYVVSYIRYVLAFKMWKGIMKCSEDRKKITKLASLKLQPPPGFREKLSTGGVLRDILPRVPKARTDVTAFLMQAKYSVKDKAKMFLKAVTDPKLHCVLDRQNFASAGDNSSNVGGKGDIENNMFMSDVWSSMSLEHDIRDSVRIANITGGSDKKKTHKAKHGGLRSVSKNDHIKKKKKKVEIPVENIGEDDKENNSCETVEDPTICAIKAEVEEVIRKEQVNQVDSVCEGDNMEVAAEVELPASPSGCPDIPAIKLEPQPSQSKETAVYPSVWGIHNFQSYYNNVGFDYAVDSKSDEFSLEKTPDNTEVNDVFEILNKDEHSVEEGRPFEVRSRVEGDNSVIQGSASLHSDAQVLEDSKSVDALSSQGMFYDKSHTVKAIKVSSGYNTEELGNDVYHEKTVKSDIKLYDFQRKIYSYSSKLNPQIWISLLAPLDYNQFKLSRCWCAVCKNNMLVLQQNWRNVMATIMFHSQKLDENGRHIDDFGDECAFEDLKASSVGDKDSSNCWETQIDNLLKKIDEMIKEDNEHCSLPLKKRKGFSYSNYVKGEKSEMNYPEMSYPGTPMMMSIAALELDKEKCSFNVLNMNHAPISNGRQINYTNNYAAHANYSTLADTKYGTVIVQSDNKNISVEQNLVPGAFTTTFVTEHQEQQKIKFKTPAQLKEFQHLSAAQDLINFAHTSRTYYNDNQEPKKEKGREKRQTRQKTKSTATTRKRKRTT